MKKLYLFFIFLLSYSSSVWGYYNDDLEDVIIRSYYRGCQVIDCMQGYYVESLPSVDIQRRVIDRAIETEDFPDRMTYIDLSFLDGRYVAIRMPDPLVYSLYEMFINR